MKAQSWQNCDPIIKDYINEVSETLKIVLESHLVGVYLHGSLATGSYYFPKSDIDLIVVVSDKLNTSTRKEIANLLASLSDKRPSYGNIEVSLITENTALNFTHPTPFEVHYSTEWHNKILNNEVDFSIDRKDPDLAAHFEYIIKRGVTLYGKEIKETFNPISWHYFIDGILDDFKWIVENENILESPFYSILNICRVIQTLSQKGENVFSKDEGGFWALDNLPEEHHPVIRKALETYHSETKVNSEDERRQGNTNWNKEELLNFRDFANTKVQELLKLF